LTSVNFNNRTYPFARLSGTSMAGPVVSGIVALLLEANPYLSAHQVKEILKESARQDNFTSNIPLDGSLIWGAGKVNAYQAIQKALETIGNVEINEIKNKIIQFYPNPTFDLLNIQLDNEINALQIQMVILLL
jgi:minor extracellular serine protease Vpr